MHKYIRPLLKSEVAALYEISVPTLINWIKEYPALQDEILRYGSFKYQQLFTLKQVEAIFKYLGYPNDFSLNDYKKRPIRVYKKKLVAEFYNISYSTLIRMINNASEIAFINENSNKKYTIIEISLIFEYLGHPLMKKEVKTTKI